MPQRPRLGGQAGADEEDPRRRRGLALISAALERRALQVGVAIAGLVPVSAGALGAVDRLGLHAGSHGRYLSGLLLAIGLIFWWTIPAIERRGPVVRTLTIIVLVGGLARLAGVPQTGAPLSVALPLVMELGVTPALALWRERIERHQAPRS